jgi:hypothetical protein
MAMKYTALAALVCIAAALSTPASAAVLVFTTGSPDGLMAMATRPSSAGVEIETADDFLLSSCTTLNSATFFGLIAGGATLANINEIDVEIDLSHLSAGFGYVANDQRADADQFASRRRVRFARYHEQRPDIFRLDSQPQLHRLKLRPERHHPEAEPDHRRRGARHGTGGVDHDHIHDAPHAPGRPLLHRSAGRRAGGQHLLLALRAAHTPAVRRGSAGVDSQRAAQS